MGGFSLFYKPNIFWTVGWTQQARRHYSEFRSLSIKCSHYSVYTLWWWSSVCHFLWFAPTARGNVTVCSEFNFCADPEAAYIVLNDYQCPTYLACWEFSCYNKLSWVRLPSTHCNIYSRFLRLTVFTFLPVLTGVLRRLVGAGHRQSSLHGTDLPLQLRRVAKRALTERVCRRHGFCFLRLVRHGSRRGRFLHDRSRPFSGQCGADGHTHQRHDDSRYFGLTEEDSQGFYHEEDRHGEIQADDDGCFTITITFVWWNINAYGRLTTVCVYRDCMMTPS